MHRPGFLCLPRMPTFSTVAFSFFLQVYSLRWTMQATAIATSLHANKAKRWRHLLDLLWHQHSRSQGSIFHFIIVAYRFRFSKWWFNRLIRWRVLVPTARSESKTGNSQLSEGLPAKDNVSGQWRASARLQATKQRAEKELLVKRRVEHLDEDEHEN